MRIAAALMVAVPTGALAVQADETPICTDRPAKANATCTVPAGTFQLEATGADWMRIDADGIRTDLWQIGGSVLKYGLTDHSDLQIGFTPYVHAETRSHGSKASASGVGDLTIRYKHRLTNDRAPIQLGLIPFVKLPTADDDVGNGKVEGGLAAPINTALGAATVSIGPELDLLADADGDGRHLQLVNLVNIAAPVAKGLTLAGELWTATNFDPDDTVTQFSADAALTYLVSSELQLDAGANVGLNKNSPDVELYAGFSLRF
jgi:hypothetical protein